MKRKTRHRDGNQPRLEEPGKADGEQVVIDFERLIEESSRLRREKSLTEDHIKLGKKALATLDPKPSPGAKVSTDKTDGWCRDVLLNIAHVAGSDAAILTALVFGKAKLSKWSGNMRRRLTECWASYPSPELVCGIEDLWVQWGQVIPDMLRRVPKNPQQRTSESLAVAKAGMAPAIDPAVARIIEDAPVGREARENLASFLAITSGPLASLSAAFVAGIQRAGGITSPEAPRAPQAAGPEARPFLLAAKECWYMGEPPAEDDYMNEMLGNLPGAQVYVRGEGREPLERRMYWSALKQLATPDVDNTCWVMSVPSQLQLLRIPERLKSLRSHDDASRETLTNITPKHTHVELHVDMGDVALTATACHAEKLVGLFPPTAHNTAVLRSKRDYVNAHEDLEGGVFVVMTPKQACFIPAGWIHTLYTTQGGLTATLDWATTECISPAMEFIREHRDRGIDEFHLYCSPFLEAVMCGLAESSCQKRTAAIEAFDATVNMLGGIRARNNPVIKNQMFGRVRELVESARTGAYEQAGGGKRQCRGSRPGPIDPPRRGGRTGRTAK